MAAKKSLNGADLIESKPKKTRQGNSQYTKLAASSRNGKKKAYRGQGKQYRQGVTRPPFFMEILFVGCSITWGDELQDRLKDRYSRLVCDALGANETNVAECGRSNDWIARRTVEEVQKKEYDRVYVQLTVPNRLEYFTEEGAHKFSLQAAERKNDLAYKMKWYYKFVRNFQNDVENMYKNKFIIESAVKCPLTFIVADCTLEHKPEMWHLHRQSNWNRLCKIDHSWIWHDILGHPFRKGPLGRKENHPLEGPHKKIADYLLNSTKYTKIV